MVPLKTNLVITMVLEEEMVLSSMFQLDCGLNEQLCAQQTNKQNNYKDQKQKAIHC